MFNPWHFVIIQIQVSSQSDLWCFQISYWSLLTVALRRQCCFVVVIVALPVTVTILAIFCYCHHCSYFCYSCFCCLCFCAHPNMLFMFCVAFLNNFSWYHVCGNDGCDAHLNTEGGYGNPGHTGNPGNPGHGGNPGNPGHSGNPGNPGNPGDEGAGAGSVEGGDAAGTEGSGKRSGRVKQGPLLEETVVGKGRSKHSTNGCMGAVSLFKVICAMTLPLVWNFMTF